MTSAFDTIHATLQGTPTKRGWFDADCPNCGKERARGQTHFGYNAVSGHCFVCGWSGGLSKLAELLRVEIGEWTPPKPQPKPEVEIARWRLNPWKMLEQYRSHPQRIEQWQAYKPLSVETIEKYDLGFGPLYWQRDNGDWYPSADNFLTVPVYEDGALVRIHGRIPRDKQRDGLKWICNSGSDFALYNLDSIQSKKVVWLCENYVDAIWLHQLKPEWGAVATGGASIWKPHWTQQIVEREPSLVVVALDNDLAGNGGGNHREALLAEWWEKMSRLLAEGKITGNPKPPKPAGPKIANWLLQAGLNVRLFDWPSESPPKAGLDWILSQEIYA